MKITCVCGAVNRLPAVPDKKIRCGKCAHVFRPRELLKAEPEPELAQQIMQEAEDAEDRGYGSEDDVCLECGEPDCDGECTDE